LHFSFSAACCSGAVRASVSAQKRPGFPGSAVRGQRLERPTRASFDPADRPSRSQGTRSFGGRLQQHLPLPLLLQVQHHPQRWTPLRRRKRRTHLRHVSRKFIFYFALLNLKYITLKQFSALKSKFI